MNIKDFEKAQGVLSTSMKISITNKSDHCSDSIDDRGHDRGFSQGWYCREILLRHHNTKNRDTSGEPWLLGVDMVWIGTAVLPCGSVQ